MLQRKCQRRSCSAITSTLALCMTVVASATAAQATNPPRPGTTSVHLDLPSAAKIAIKGIGFGTAGPTVSMGGTPLAVSDGFSNTRVVASVPARLFALLSAREGYPSVFATDADGSYRDRQNRWRVLR